MKPIMFTGYNHYQVSEEGVVVNTLTNKVLKNDLNSCGYKRVTLSSEGKVIRITVHRLVALHYIDGHKDDLVVNHKDGNKINNHYRNLEWVTQSDNRKHAFRHRLVRRPNSKLSDAEVHMICAAIEKQIPAQKIRVAFQIPKHVYDDIRSRRYYKDISDLYDW